MTAASSDDHAAWRAFFSELASCLFDDSRPRQKLQPLGQAAQAEKIWPTRSQSDEYLLAGVLRLAWAFAGAGPQRRAMLGPVILAVLKETERLVWDAPPATLAGAAVPPFDEQPFDEQPAPVLAPEPGDPLFRRDIHS